LDTDNENEILKTIYGLRGKQTMIIIAHRLTTVKFCDKLIEFEKGKIVNIGIPDDILK